MMIRSLILFLILISVIGFSQEESFSPLPGNKAASFIINVRENTIQSITMPYMKKIILLHFWSSNVSKTREVNRHLNRLARKYQNSSYKNSEGFEIIAIAVQTDKNSWMESINKDSLHHLTHGIAVRGYNDAVCKKYGVTSLPTDFLIDEAGIILAVNPRIIDIENVLDERKNFQPIKKDITGILAQSSDKNEVLKYSRLYLFNYYGDSITNTVTGENGNFVFNEVKLNQDFVLKVNNIVDINTSDPIALYSPTGEFVMDGRTKDEGFVFNISSRNSNKLLKEDTLSVPTHSLGEIDVVKSLTFSSDGSWLTPGDEQQLKPILIRLQKNKALSLEFITHTDARMDPSDALELTARQATALKNYFQKKGIAPARLKAIAKGNSELRKLCEGMTDCREEDHKLNRRVEFLVFKD